MPNLPRKVGCHGVTNAMRKERHHDTQKRICRKIHHRPRPLGEYRRLTHGDLISASPACWEIGKDREGDDLAAWLEAFTGPVIPPDFERLNKKLRKHFGLSHDEARHSFISYHAALHRSIGDAALQAGNSESIVKHHYLNTHPREEGGEFFRIIPSERKAALAPLPAPAIKEHLKVV